MVADSRIDGACSRFVLRRAVLAAIVALVFGSCQTFNSLTGRLGPDERGSGAETQTAGRSEMAPASEIQRAVVANALAVQGYNGQTMTIRGREFPMDCTGLVLALYYHAGVDLAAEFGSYGGNGVSRLHQYLDDLGFLIPGTEPSPGDLIFWDNTYDRNENRKFDDPLTHVGMVVSVEDDGTIRFMHHHYREGAVIAEMNLSDPDSWERNAAMRMRGAEPRIESKILASQLINAFGEAWRVEP